MNKFVSVLGSRVRAARLAAMAAGTSAMFMASNAMAADELTAALDAVDLSGLVVKIAAAGLVIVGIAMAFKGPTLGKRVISKV